MELRECGLCFNWVGKAPLKRQNNHRSNTMLEGLKKNVTMMHTGFVFSECLEGVLPCLWRCRRLRPRPAKEGSLTLRNSFCFCLPSIKSVFRLMWDQQRLLMSLFQRLWEDRVLLMHKCSTSYVLGNFSPCSKWIDKQAFSVTSFCTVKVKDQSEGTKSTTHCWVEVNLKWRLKIYYVSC